MHASRTEFVRVVRRRLWLLKIWADVSVGLSCLYNFVCVFFSFRSSVVQIFKCRYVKCSVLCRSGRSTSICICCCTPWRKSGHQTPRTTSRVTWPNGSNNWRPKVAAWPSPRTMSRSSKRGQTTRMMSTWPWWMPTSTTESTSFCCCFQEHRMTFKWPRLGQGQTPRVTWFFAITDYGVKNNFLLAHSPRPV